MVDKTDFISEQHFRPEYVQTCFMLNMEGEPIEGTEGTLGQEFLGIDLEDAMTGQGGTY